MSDDSVNLLDETHRSLRSIRRLLIFMLLIMLGVIFYFAKDIIMPLALGMLITLTLTPVVRFLSKTWMPPGAAAVLVILTVGGVFGVGVYGLSTPINDLFSSFPEIGDRIGQKLLPYRSSMDSISEATEQVEELAGGNTEDQAQKVVIQQPGLISTAATSVASGITSFAVALLFALFMLSSGTLFYEKIVSVMPALSEKKKALRIVYDVEDSVSHYLFTITLINIGLGVVVGSLLYLAGTPSAVMWGVIAATLNFLPFLGAWIGTATLVALSMGLYDTLFAALVPGFIYLACSTLEGNIVTPLIVGKRLKINTVAVFLAVVIWGWLWNIAGALMAVPILVVVKVLCDHVDNWQNFGEFLAVRRNSYDAELDVDRADT